MTRTKKQSTEAAVREIRRRTEQQRVAATKKPLRVTPRRGSRMLEHETGLEPATPTLAISFSAIPS